MKQEKALLYALCHKSCPLLVFEIVEKSDTFCGREHTMPSSHMLAVTGSGTRKVKWKNRQTEMVQFRLETGHDLLAKHLHKLGIAD
jgi:hypothetical protein